MKAPKPMFGIGSTVAFVKTFEKKGKTKQKEQQWKVVRYYKIGEQWECMMQSVTNGVHKSFRLSELEDALIQGIQI